MQVERRILGMTDFTQTVLTTPHRLNRAPRDALLPLVGLRVVQKETGETIVIWQAVAWARLGLGVCPLSKDEESKRNKWREPVGVQRSFQAPRADSSADFEAELV
jgi:hypothetical protein